MSATTDASAGYDLEGTLLEVCSCEVLCPCWIGEDPDEGTCEAILSYQFDRGEIAGIDVGGLTVVAAVLIPGNVLAGGWKQVVFVDARASDEQERAMLDFLDGELGGPIGDLAGLVDETLGVERAEIRHEIEGGRGTLRIDGAAHCEIEPYVGPTGSTTTLQDSIFSTVPGSPAYVARASRNDVDLPRYGMSWSFEGRNAIQSDWRMSHAGG